MSDIDVRAQALSGTLMDFARPRGADLLGRTSDFFDWSEARQQAGGWPFRRVLSGAPTALVDSADGNGRVVRGLNFASTDYLGLASHPTIREAAARAAADFGVHSACSPALQGETDMSLALGEEIGDLLQMDHVLVFPTGWAAGFGAIVALVRDYDHIVMDKLTHSCLQQGAYAATRHVGRHAHLDVDRARERLRAIRKRDPSTGILVITEGLFSMDSDAPRLEALQAACHEFEATLLVDVAHDLGQMGPGGTGQIGIQQMLGKIDLVMGAFSKSFASNGGFVAANSESVTRYIGAYASSWTFSTALSPIETSVAREALRIIRSDEGDELREALRRNAEALRETLVERDLRCYGEPSSLVPVAVGSERTARIASGLLHRDGLAVNLVEFPAVPLGGARFRMQTMATHSVAQAQQAGTTMADALAEAESLVDGVGPSATVPA